MAAVVVVVVVLLLVLVLPVRVALVCVSGEVGAVSSYCF